MGFIAQDVQNILPDAVTYLEDGQYLGIDYNSIIPVIIEGIKDLVELCPKKAYNCSDICYYDDENKFYSPIELKIKSVEDTVAKLKDYHAAVNESIHSLSKRVDHIEVNLGITHTHEN